MKRAMCIIGLAAAVLLSSCVFIDTDDDHDWFKNFDHSLRGTWETLPSTVSSEKMTIIIDDSSIKIIGKGKSNHPLRHITTDTQLKGYSKESDKSHSWLNPDRKGSLYIYDKGSSKDPVSVSYEYWVSNDEEKRLTFPGTNELTMKLQ